MKNISLTLFLVFIHIASLAQNDFYPNLPWLRLTDMVVGKEILRVRVKKIYRDGQVSYCFKVSIDEDQIPTFEILASVFLEGECLNTLCFTKIKISTRLSHLLISGKRPKGKSPKLLPNRTERFEGHFFGYQRDLVKIDPKIGQCPQDAG